MKRKGKRLVVDRIGNIVKTIRNLESGAHELTFNRGELPAGLYLYKIVADQGATQTKEFIIE